MTKIRLGSLDDLDNCLELARSFTILAEVQTPPTGGFFLHPPTLCELELMVFEKRLLVAEKDEELLGFAYAYSKSSKLWELLLSEIETNIVWDGEDLLLREDLVFLDKIVVSNKGRRYRAAAELYYHICRQNPVATLVGALLEKPILNIRVQRMMKAMGFKRVGSFFTDNFRDINGYQIGIHVRKLRGWN